MIRKVGRSEEISFDLRDQVEVVVTTEHPQNKINYLQKLRNKKKKFEQQSKTEITTGKPLVKEGAKFTRNTKKTLHNEEKEARKTFQNYRKFKNFAPKKIKNPSKTKTKLFSNRELKEVPKLIEDFDDAEDYQKYDFDIDQKAVEAEEVLVKVENTRTTPSDVTYKQMNFWRNRFESERLRDFLSKERDVVVETTTRPLNKRKKLFKGLAKNILTGRWIADHYIHIALDGIGHWPLCLLDATPEVPAARGSC